MTASTAPTRHNTAPVDPQCPFCIVATGGETLLNTQHDIVRTNQHAIALISPRWWPNNKGHVLVIPKDHYKNLYKLPSEHGHAVHDLRREVAIAIRHTYDCHGVSTRQHNEEAGGQDVWHYHEHVYPRFTNDNLYASEPMPDYVSFQERQIYAEKLRNYFYELSSPVVGSI